MTNPSAPEWADKTQNCFDFGYLLLGFICFLRFEFLDFLINHKQIIRNNILKQLFCPGR